VDQPNRYPRTPDPVLGVTQFVNLPSPRPRNKFPHVLKFRSRPLLDLNNLFGDLVLENARSVVQRSENMNGILFGRLDDPLLDSFMDRTVPAHGIKTLPVARQDTLLTSPLYT